MRAGPPISRATATRFAVALATSVCAASVAAIGGAVEAAQAEDEPETAASESDAPAWPWPATQGVSILLAGDANFQGREKPEDALRHVRATIAEADVTFLNLEGPFAGASTDSNAPDVPHKDWQHSEPGQVAALTASGVDLVGVANNVTYPWPALMRSLAVLEEADVQWVGGGADLNAAHAPAVREIDGVVVGFLQYASTVFPFQHAAGETRPGGAHIKVHTAYQDPEKYDKPGTPAKVVTWLDPASKARMTGDVAALKTRSDVVIVSYHWGLSNTTEALDYQSDIARAVIDAGADVVFGHGPHRYQKVEIYKGKPILHSLAQLAFDDRRRDRRTRFREGLLARVVADKEGLAAVSLVPTWRDDDNDVRLYDPRGGKGAELARLLISLSDETSPPLRISGPEIVIEGVR
ncbi:MAG: CapA family protein [Parvularculaceae bacterium]